MSTKIGKRSKCNDCEEFSDCFDNLINVVSDNRKNILDNRNEIIDNRNYIIKHHENHDLINVVLKNLETVSENNFEFIVQQKKELDGIKKSISQCRKGKELINLVLILLTLLTILSLLVSILS